MPKPLYKAVLWDFINACRSLKDFLCKIKKNGRIIFISDKEVEFSMTKSMKKRTKITYYFYLIILPIFSILLRFFESWSKAYSDRTFIPVSTIVAVGLPIVYGLLIGIDTLFMDKLLKKDLMLPKIIEISFLLIVYLISFSKHHDWLVATNLLVPLGYQTVTLIQVICQHNGKNSHD